MTIVLAIIGAIIPSLLLLWYFYKRDLNPEPRDVLIKTFLLGILIVLPVMIFAFGLLLFRPQLNHPLLAGLLRLLPDTGVGHAEGHVQPLPVLQGLHQGLQRQGAGHLPGGVPAHPVGDRHQHAPVGEASSQDRVFLVRPLPGDRLDRQSRLVGQAGTSGNGGKGPYR